MRRRTLVALLLEAMLLSGGVFGFVASAPTMEAAAADRADAASVASASASIDPTVPPATATPAPAAPTPTPAATPAPTPTPTPTPTPRPAPPATPTPAPNPFPVTNTAALPPCEYKDLPTLVSPVWAWNRILVDKAYSVGSQFVPPDLVPVGFAGFRDNYQVRGLLIDDLRALREAATRAGAGLAIVSAYRGYNEQIWSFNHWLRVLGPIAVMSSARPGHSEHQLGLAIDFRAARGSMPWNYRDWSKETASGAWMAQNAWKFGFVMSYPVNKAAQVCYGYEPWHYRYVGRDEAAAIHASGETSRLWLWRHQPQQPLPPATPAPTEPHGVQ